MKIPAFLQQLLPMAAMLALFVGYEDFVKPRLAPAAPAPVVAPAPAPDPVALDLGAKYKAAFDAAGVASLDAVATNPAATTADLVKAQRAALDAALKSAWAPIAAEATKRFGKVGSASGPGGTLGTDPVTVALAQPVDAVRAFYRDVAAGYRKAK